MKSPRQCFAILAAFVLLMAGCTTVDLYEKTTALPNRQWPSAQKPDFSFDITDTVSRYNLYVVVRHLDAYRYNNLWVNIYTKAPGDSTAKPQALDLQLASNDKGWLGSGMDDIFEHRIKISQAPLALRAGTYRFQLEQIMRDEPLENIINVGIRVEKAQE